MIGSYCQKSWHVHENGGLVKRFLLGSHRRTRGILASAVAVSLVVPLSAAHADGDDESLRVETYVQPLGAEPLTLDQLNQPDGLERLRRLQTPEALAAVLPHEAIGEAKSSAPRAPVGSAQPPTSDDEELPAEGASPADTADAVISLPEPSHTMTPQQCVTQLADRTFYVKSRYAVCSGREFGQVWYRNGEAVGKSHFDVVVIGTIPKNSREMTATYYYTDFTATGDNDARKLGITTSASISHKWPSTTRITKGGNTLPVTRTWSELLDGRPLKQTITAPSGQPGSLGSTRLIAAIYQPNIKLVAPPGWADDGFTGGDIFMLPPRWDEADYLPGSAAGGAAVFSVVATLKYKTAASAPEREVAAHIKKAFTKPGETVPLFSRKQVAGQNTDEALTRLYSDTERRKKNRNRSVYNCKKYFGDDYAQGGKKQCDEYPFATTYQGAAGPDYDPYQDRNNFSVMPVSKESNEAAGVLLGQFYDKNRLIDGPDDGFIVKVTS
ncbi:hypothetical protein [Streptomyces sp. NPDC046862]|uniref:NucA/NucB deoxyribonuclease domain-containing protein n=1 Tax=Streptomyces sp. NPDC046862 TaxID=3154603 RepID=UPI00345593F4